MSKFNFFSNGLGSASLRLLIKHPCDSDVVIMQWVPLTRTSAYSFNMLVCIRSDSQDFVADLFLSFITVFIYGFKFIESVICEVFCFNVVRVNASFLYGL